MPGKKHGRGTARGRGNTRREAGQGEPQRPGQGPEVGGAAAPAPQPAVPQQQGHPLGAWAQPPRVQGQPQGAWARGQPPTGWGQGQPQSARGQGPTQGQSRPALGQGPSQGQSRPPRGQGPPQGQPRSAWGQGPPQGQPQPAWGQGPPQGQQQVPWGQGRSQDQPQPALGQGPPQRQPQTAWAQPPQRRGPPESHEPQQAGDQAASTLPGSGRAVRRGVTRTQEGRAGDASVEQVARGMEEVAIQGGAVGGGDAPRRQRRNPYEHFIRYPEGLTKKGDEGRPVTLRGNFFRMSVPKDLKLYQYHVDFSPVCDSTKMKWQLLSHHDVGAVKAFDGTALYLIQKLPSDEQVFYTRRFIDNADVKITIRFICEVACINPSALQFLNIVWRRILNLMNLKQIQRHFYDMEGGANIAKHGLQVFSGFQSSILQFDGGVLLDIDISHKIMRSRSVLETIEDIFKANLGLDVETYRQMVQKEVVGQVVLAKYGNKTYLITDIHWEGRVTDTFERVTEKENSVMSYVDYYASNYKVHIMDMNQPLLVTRGRRRVDKHGNLENCNIFLVPELVFPTGLTEASKMDFGLKKDLATHTKINPQDRVNRLSSFMQNLKANEQATEEMQKWRLNFQDSLVEIDARQYKPEVINMMKQGHTKEQKTLQYRNADWGRAVQEAKMILGVNLENWLLVYSRECSRNVRKLVQSLQRVGPPLGMRIADPRLVQADSQKGDSYVRALRSNLKKGETKMAVCILPNNRKDRYDSIKKHCCLTFPVASQMVLDKTLNNDQRILSVATKIAIQMNCKLGGVIWNLSIPPKNTMIIGIDTYHDSSRKDCSAVGVVATINSDYTRYKSTVGFQLRHQELGDQLQSCVVACLHAYREEHDSHVLPKKVIVFRDGIGDGQLQLCVEHEVSQIKRAIGKDIQLAFIVVKKRINARFFLERETGGAGGRGDPRGPRGQVSRKTYSNPEPGTVIDSVATKPSWFDFFLISQTVREGTVSPTHYNVLLNEPGYLPKHYQSLAYKMTHMYYNWQGTIRVPAPCMYAHKLAFLVGQSLHQEPHGDLTKHLYYL